MNWLRRVFAARQTTPERYPESTGYLYWGSWPLNIRMTHEEALRLSAVWAAANVIAKAISSSVWSVFRALPNGNREMAEGTPLYRLLNARPNGEMTAYAFRETALIQAMLWGDFFAEIERDLLGRPVALWPLLPDRAKLERNIETDALELKVTNQYGSYTTLPYRDVFHLHGPSLNGIAGMDTVMAAAKTLAHMKAAEEFGVSFYDNGVNPSGVLSTDEKLTQQQRDELAEGLNEKHAGPRNGSRVLIMSHGLRWQPISIEPDKAQFIETRKLLIEEVARWFGVPPHKIGHLDRATFNNIEHQGIEFVRDALTPWCERLRQEADAKLTMLRDPLMTRIDIDWHAEGDAKSKAETDKILTSGGIITINEARRRRGMNTVGPEGDVLMVQGQMIPLDRIGGDDAEPEQAAEMLFAQALAPEIRRLWHRARDAGDALRDRMDALMEDHGRRVGAAIQVKADVLRALGYAVEIDPATLVHELAKHRAMLLEGTECNADARAAQIASRLVKEAANVQRAA